ncbi:unnamed protein product [Rotaria sp. Silwood2]|nr:unnamed protein product [Rotaria sp. Silwood2]CAF2977305.1 unnamed protein product [Rotaria sp. Silwood2]CAF3080275.1 unnamed protein product [Rotaria sp. Silwood2]CAF4003820.1 unnamed protein product [Rotaria sp. Silwood2]CAF4071486.1 unnamed protein product [Rotaria sp. Silwood2]
MGTPGDDGRDINPNHHNENDHINQTQLEYGNTTNKEDNLEGYHRNSNKQKYEPSDRKQRQLDSFPPFRITIKDCQYPIQDIAIIKDMNRKCKLNLTYGRMSSKSNRCYLLYCNTSMQFEYLLEKAKWPDKICDLEYTFETPRIIPSSYSSYNTYWEKGTNNFGGVLIAVHRSISVQKVDIFQHLPNVIVLDIGTTADKFQLATCYSPPNENLPISLFDKILKRNINTALLGDFNAKHQSWSSTIDNHKERVLFNWLSINALVVVNKCVPTSTRSNATIDLILAPTHMIASTSSFCVFPSIGSNHFPVLLIPTNKLHKRDCLYPIKRTYWTLFKLFLVFTFSFWNDLSSKTDDTMHFFSTYERFLALLASRLTYVSYCNEYKPSLPPHIINLMQ